MNTGRYAICDNHVECRQNHDVCKYGYPHRWTWPLRRIRCLKAPKGKYPQDGYIPRRGLTEDESLLMLGLPPAGTGPSIWDPSEIGLFNALTLEGTSQKNSKKVKKPVKRPPTRYELLRRAHG